MFDFAGANTMGQCAESTVRGGMRIAANDGHARQGCAIFRAYDMHDALPFGKKREVRGQSNFPHIGVQRQDLFLAGWVGDAFVSQMPAGGWGVVVSGGNNRADAPELAPSLA